jgi:hypothetical protein
MKAYLATLSETDVLYKSTNANVEAQTTKVAGLQAAYISSIAYARRGWLEGFTSSILGGGAPGSMASGISRLPAEGQLKGSGWTEGMPLTKGAMAVEPGMVSGMESGIYNPTRADKTWGDMVYPSFGGGPGEQIDRFMRTFGELITNGALNTREVNPTDPVAAIGAAL